MQRENEPSNQARPASNPTKEMDAAMCETTTYRIIRFRFDGNNEVIETGLTLEEAQEHCRREDTKGDGWFDGFDED